MIGAARKNHNAQGGGNSHITLQEIRANLEQVVQEHYSQKKEKVIVEMLYLEQFVKRYKEVILMNIDECLKDSLAQIRQASLNDIG